MLPATLNTNEVKNAAGAEVEFERLSAEGRTVIFRKIGESPAYPHRITISHKVDGDGTSARRRSLLDTSVSAIGQVDTSKANKVRVYTVCDVPEGNITDLTLVQTALAYHQSFLASRGVSTAILYDGTGCGAEALLNGSV